MFYSDSSVFTELALKLNLKLLEQVWWKAMKMIKGLTHLSYEEWLGELGLFNVKKGQVRGELIKVYSCLKRGCQEDGSRLFFGGAKH